MSEIEQPTALGMSTFDQSPHLYGKRQIMSRIQIFPTGVKPGGTIDSIRTEADPQMRSYNSSEILISVLRSTSFLLEHYGYSKHDPSLSELQLSLRRATERLAVQARTDDETLTPIES